MRKTIVKIRNKLSSVLYKLAKKLYVPEPKKKFVRKGMRRTFAVLLLVGLFGCIPSQEPVQTVINYTDNSQTIQVAGDGNQLSATSDIQAAEQTATPTQTTENTTKNDMWKFWVVLLFVAIGGGVLLYWYQKKKVL